MDKTLIVRIVSGVLALLVASIIIYRRKHVA
jgi:hypothetical protein